MRYWIVDGKQITDAEYEELQRQKSEAKERVQREAAALMEKLGQTYEALTSLMQQNPEVGRQVTDRTAADEEIYRKLRQNLQQADQAPRCQAIKADGTGCGSPKMNNHIYCYAHYRMLEARAEKLVLPSLEDANGILMAVMVVQRALIDDEISEKKAGLLLYSLQIAAAKVDQTTFGQAKDEDLVTEMEDEEESIERHEQIVEKRKRLEEITGRRRFTQIGADQDGKALPLINTDDTDERSGDLHPTKPKSGLAGTPGDLVIARDRVIGTAKAPNSAPNGSAVGETYAKLG